MLQHTTAFHRPRDHRLVHFAETTLRFREGLGRYKLSGADPWSASSMSRRTAAATSGAVMFEVSMTVAR